MCDQDVAESSDYELETIKRILCELDSLENNHQKLRVLDYLKRRCLGVNPLEAMGGGILGQVREQS